jgi:hypothetical protein
MIYAFADRDQQEPTWHLLRRQTGAKARESAVASIKALADQHAANVLPVIHEIRRAGAISLRDIADALNARGVTTARGGQCYASSVRNILARV